MFAVYFSIILYCISDRYYEYSFIIMKYYLILILFILILFPLDLLSFSNGIFSKNSTIVHLETGLFLNYMGLYRPSDIIIHNSAIFPMTIESCHFLPLVAAAKIPSCNVSQRIHKRAVLGVIALGVGILQLGMSVMNTIQISNLNEQMDIVEKTLVKFNNAIDIHEAKLAHLHSNQIKLIAQLQVTQQAINSMIPILDSHAQLLNQLKTDIAQLHSYIQRSFLAIAINRIFRNELNLNFLLPDDLHKVVYNVIDQGNLTFSSEYATIPLVEIITKLLVRQQIDFIPNLRNNPMYSKEIGQLIITNFFAVPQRPKQQQTSFYVYKLLAVPFYYNNESLQLSEMPQYWAINPRDNTTIEWYKPDEFGCNLQLMTTCRDTPPVRSIKQDTCLGQIIRNDYPLSTCHIKSISQLTVFIQQLSENLWIISSRQPIHCLKTAKIKYHNPDTQYKWTSNEAFILPPVALVNITSDNIIICPGFTLFGRTNSIRNSSLTILYNNKLASTDTPVLDIYQYLTENTTWFKKNWSEESIETLLNHIQQQAATILSGEKSSSTFNYYWHLFLILMMSLVTFIVIILLKNYFSTRDYLKIRQFNL